MQEEIGQVQEDDLSGTKRRFGLVKGDWSGKSGAYCMELEGRMVRLQKSLFV